MLNMPRLKHALALGLLFFVVSSPYTYTLVDKVVGGLASALVPQMAGFFKVAEGGCPTTYGLALHSGVFVVAAYLLHRSL
jgi:hypothetical protein